MQCDRSSRMTLFLSKISVKFTLLSILTLLAFPVLSHPYNMVNLLHVNLYLFEIPLIISLLASLMTLRITKIDNVAFVFSIILLLIIGVLNGVINNSAQLKSVVTDIRPVFYWLSGLSLLFIDHKYFTVGKLAFVVTLGLIVQFVFAIIMVINDPYLLLDSYFRMPGRSIWLSFIAFIVSFSFFENSSPIIVNEHKLLRWFYYTSSFILLIYLIIGQNRTTWAGGFILVSYYFVFKLSLKNKIRFAFIILTFFIISYSAFNAQKTTNYETFIPYIQKRLVENTLTSDGVNDSLKGREGIYDAMINDFMNKPVLGNGFGHHMKFNLPNLKNDLVGDMHSISDNSYFNVLVKTGIVGLFLFCIAIISYLKILKKCKDVTDNIFNKIYYEAFYLSSLTYMLMATNLAIYYGYPEAIIFSFLLFKLILVVSEKKRLNSFR